MYVPIIVGIPNIWSVVISNAIDLAFSLIHSFTALTIFSLIILLSSLFSFPNPTVNMYVEGYFFWVWRTKISPDFTSRGPAQIT